MAKRSNQKLKILYVLKILLENTDSKSGMTLSQISAELAKYNISAARKSLYDDIESLRLFGVDVCIMRDRYVRYYIGRRDFSFIEIKYIVDALEKFDSIDPSVARDLSEKVIRNLGVKGRAYSQGFADISEKMPEFICETFDKNIEIISEAISNNQKIRFKEFLWNPQKQRILKNDGAAITVTPILLSNDNNRYRLYAFDGIDVNKYTVDRLLDIDILPEKGELRADHKAVLDSAFEPPQVNVRVEVDSSFASDVFEFFGLGVTILSREDGSFEFSVKVSLDDRFYFWLFSNAEHIRRISPESVVEEYKQRLLKALNVTKA